MASFARELEQELAALRQPTRHYEEQPDGTVHPVEPPADVAALVGRLEDVYKFECEAGPLSGCVDWQELKIVIASLSALCAELESTLAQAREDAERHRFAMRHVYWYSMDGQFLIYC